jgi:broad specificity phosphatase PhoE
MEEDNTNLNPPDIETPEFGEIGSIKRIIVVRHGESVANTQGIFQGQTYDTDLSELGFRQAKALAERLKELGVSKIITSPLKRTYQTALEISRTTNADIEVRNEVIETNHGVWEGKSKDWIQENYKGVYDMWMEAPSQTTFPHGEAFMDTVNRVESFIDDYELIDGAAIVAHDNVLRIITAFAKGDLIDKIWDYEIEPAALNFFEVNQVGGKNKLKLLKINDIEHLGDLRADLSNHAL